MIRIPDRMLVFAAHQDDETIGCGATIKKFSSLGCNVRVVFVTDGSTGIDQSRSFENDIVQTRKEESEKALATLGVNSVVNLGLPCQKVENNINNFHKFIREIRKFKPDIILTHSDIDKHRDHRAVSQIVTEASWKSSENILPDLGASHSTKDIWAFEVLDPIKPDFVVDIDGFFPYKINALKQYSSQYSILNGESIFDYVDGISKVRGFAIGAKRGEGFRRISLLPVRI